MPEAGETFKNVKLVKKYNRLTVKSTEFFI